MTNNVETALSYLSQIRKVYAERLNIKFQEENFSPNEISVLILLSNNKSINTSSQLTTILGVSKSLVSRSLAALEKDSYRPGKQAATGAAGKYTLLRTPLRSRNSFQRA